MSDYRDPRDPVHRDPLYNAMNDPALRDARAQALSPGAAVAWFVGIALFIGVLIFAFGSGDSTRVAQNQPPGATTPAPTTPPAKTPGQ